MSKSIGNVSSLIKRLWARQRERANCEKIQRVFQNDAFQFLETGELIDDELQLFCAQFHAGNAAKSVAPQYIFRMIRRDDSAKMGSISLRIGDTKFLTHFAGHIGYGVDEAFRGRHLAARSVRLLLPLARRHAINPLWITCNPENFASRRSCEIAGGQFVEIVDLPHDCEMYLRGERRKCRYKFEL